jgi:hypothetical protein
VVLLRLIEEVGQDSLLVSGFAIHGRGPVLGLLTKFRPTGMLEGDNRF